MRRGPPNRGEDEPPPELHSIHRGKVASIKDYGVFVEMEGRRRHGLVHISQISEDRVDKVKDALKVGQEVEARVIKVDKTERRVGLSIKAANYDQAALPREAATMETLRPGEDMVGLGAAFDLAQEEYRPGDSKKKK